ncbi:potassium voltage-gated channel subfamily C member 1 isoform X2 [Hydra vulgaris]|uniref:potassium voltage-gated channel subfamily C member 1 isoform X2 n=1 Tax=Hydra vulgaris TaxID=6087 RepID=UPI001F5F294A|nr:potassium voltage-gated channel subfamily C member 1-like isoform X2 [Hydra vulgaris]
MANQEDHIKPQCLPKSIDRVVIIVGGSRHECYISTILNFPDTRLFWIAETALAMGSINTDSCEFYFDRHPRCFENILNYCRTGRLHCPNDVCGPLFQEELKFWGVDESMMQPCCWPRYSEFRDVSKNLTMFQDEDEETTSLKEKSDKNLNVRGPMNKLSQKIWSLLNLSQKRYIRNIISFANILILMLSIATFCLSTEPTLKKHEELFYSFEIFYCVCFSLDFFLSTMCCSSLVKHFKDYLTWFDIVSILPFYLEIIIKKKDVDLLLPMRLLRILRLPRYFKNLRGVIVIVKTLKASMELLMLLVFALGVPMIVFATIMYYTEKKNGFESIPRSFWWAIVTLTTVGYGEMVPTTVPGKIIGGICAMFGILIVALPISVIGSNFSFYYSYIKAKMELPKHEQNAFVNPDEIANEKKFDRRFNPAKKNHILKVKKYSIQKTSEIPKDDNIVDSNKSIRLTKVSVLKSGILNSLTSRVFDDSIHYKNFHDEETSFQTSNNEHTINNIQSYEHSNSKFYDDEFINNGSNTDKNLCSEPRVYENNNDNLIKNNEISQEQIKNSFTSMAEFHSFKNSTESQHSTNITATVNKCNSETKDRQTKDHTFINADQSDPTKNHNIYSEDANNKIHKYKKVIHLDIGQFQPRRISTKNRAAIRQKLNSLNKSNVQINKRNRTVSLVKQDVGKNEVLVWCDDSEEGNDI